MFEILVGMWRCDGGPATFAVTISKVVLNAIVVTSQEAVLSTVVVTGIGCEKRNVFGLGACTETREVGIRVKPVPQGWFMSGSIPELNGWPSRFDSCPIHFVSVKQI